MKTEHKGSGNRNAAKPPEAKRVSLSIRVLPETRAALKAAAKGASVGRVVDQLVNNQTKGTK